MVLEKVGDSIGRRIKARGNGLSGMNSRRKTG